MIKTADLKAQTRRELAELAKSYGVSGWHSMRKDDLVSEISKVQRRLRRKAEAKKSAPAAKSQGSKKASPAARTSTVKSKSKATASANKGAQLAAARARAAAVSAQRCAEVLDQTEQKERVSAKTARIRAQMRRRRETLDRHRDISTGTLVGGSAVTNGTNRTRATETHQDRVVLLVRDSYWLQATWEITRASVQRAESAMAERWHSAKPILRVLAVGDVASNQAESVARDIPIHGGVNNWYIDVDEPPSRFRVIIGYLADFGEFYTICRSNIVETPRPGECERLDEHWSDIAEDYERFYSLSGGYDQDGGDLKAVFEERLHRPMPSRGSQGQTVADPSMLRQSKLPFQVDAELIVFGKTTPTASVNIAGRPVKLQTDGSFTVRMELPDKRQVLPVTCESRDGLRQRTTVIAVERNTKVMETVEIDDRF
ncbi:hypothetical protein Pla52o_05090 [Novipirellula galeiformis]|uniref:Rho termination factor-like N-terminal domain-containing protein n=1 Tax=Novipirellula galeiformis TaxID=2528004 RepID=A0A5C6CUD7_9BACT|nr:DUF4912 domain-containing protein [Novipirellula galeiformis]TWU26656.1 hypothetical protein Pla52o_05090 [Novipirellula galeiformis]